MRPSPSRIVKRARAYAPHRRARRRSPSRRRRRARSARRARRHATSSPSGATCASRAHELARRAARRPAGASGKPSAGARFGMPDADPQSLDVAAALGERERIVDPRARRFDVLVLAERAIHPDERRLVEADRLLALRVPEREHVGGAEPEAVAIGEAVGRIVRRSRRRACRAASWRRACAGSAGARRSAPLRRSSAAARAARRTARDRRRSRSCRAGRSRDRRRATASKMRRAGCGVGAIGEIAGARRRERRTVAEHEPGRANAVTLPRRRAASAMARQTTGRPIESDGGGGDARQPRDLAVRGGARPGAAR